MDPKIGSSYGPYVVEAVIARGGQGLVLKTRHAQRGVPAALKILFNTGDLSRGRFLREMETLRLLADHPGLPTPYDLGEHEGTLFIALELVEGRSLKDMVKAGGPLPEEEALLLVAKTARVVAECHEKGVLHRDLKPANVVLRESGSPCVVDFGVARVEGSGVSDTSRLSVTGDLIGTPAFMAPEQVSGEGVGFQTDVYGLGSILFFLLSGQQPVSGTTALNVITRLARDATPDVRQANPAVSAATAELLLRAMAKDPAERVQSAAAFADDLEALVGSAGQGASSGRLPLGLAAVAAFLLLGVAAAFAMAREPEPLPGSAPSSPASGESPSSPSPLRRALTPLAPGTATWEVTFQGSAILSHTPLGPWALVETAPLVNDRPQRKLLQSHFVSLDEGGQKLRSPNADLWCWDAPRQRALCYVDRKLLSVSPGEPTPKVLAEGVGVLCALAASEDAIYTSRPQVFEIRDLEGEVLRRVPIQGHAEAPPLELDLDPRKPGPDRLLVVTSGSQALLLNRDGRVLDAADLPGPVSTLPLVLDSDPEGAEIGLVSGAGLLIRLQARARSLRLGPSYSLGATRRRGPLQPRGPLLVDRDATGTPRQVFLQLLSGIACLSPDLSSLRWRATHPAPREGYVLRGLARSDLDRDGKVELLATYLQSQREKPKPLVHVLHGPQGRAISVGPLHPSPRSAEALPEGSLLLTSARDTLVRWGPWTRLPTADPGISPPPRPQQPRQLKLAAALELTNEIRKNLPLELRNDLPPYTLELLTNSPQSAGGAPVKVRGSAEVQSCYMRGAYEPKPGAGALLTTARLDVTFVLSGNRPAGQPWLAIDALLEPNHGRGFAEYAVVITGQDPKQVQTLQPTHRKSHALIPLGEIPAEGVLEVQVYLTSRTRVRVRLNRIRLTFRETP